MKMRAFGAFVLAVSMCSFGALAQGHSANARKTAKVYVAHLHSMNSKASGAKTSGEARFTINGDRLTITVNVRGAAPGIMHMQHIHGFTNGNAASCPAESADVNGDGYVDLHETEPASGTTMVPLTADPVSMKVATDTYPKASEAGTYHYRETVSLKALQAAFAKAFPGQKLDLDHRVVYVHGVPPKTKLPASVASLGTVPAQVTLPIACGKIERVER